MLNTGELVDLSGTVTEGTETELKTSTTYSVSAVSIGQLQTERRSRPFSSPSRFPTAQAMPTSPDVVRSRLWCRWRQTDKWPTPAVFLVSLWPPVMS